jgi:glycosyltransferase involved in cell wall biosynthesis
MKKVLIISYNFPPVGGAGVQRPVKFVKYLRDFGWEPIVLSVANPSVPIIDESLLKDIPSKVKVYRAKTLEPSYSVKSRVSRPATHCLYKSISLLKNAVSQFLLPDAQILWWPGLIFKLIYIIFHEKPDVLFVSAPPFSSFMPVVAIALLFRVPVVLDYRDEWSFSRDNWENSIKNCFAKKLDIMLEGFVLKYCTAFVTANQSYIDSICYKYNFVDKSKGLAITNGYDPDDIAKRYNVFIDNSKVQFVYTGTIWRATSLCNFMTALEMLLDDDQSGVRANNLSVKIYGRVVNEEKCYLESTKYSTIVNLYGYVDHAKILKETFNTDVLLLSLSDLPGADRIITGKVFEYMATGKHILAIVPDGETKNILLENYNNVTIVNPNNPTEIYLGLQNIIRSIDGIRKIKANNVSQFSRIKLTHRLAMLFNKITNNVDSTKMDLQQGQ